MPNTEENPFAAFAPPTMTAEVPQFDQRDPSVRPDVPDFQTDFGPDSDLEVMVPEAPKTIKKKKVEENPFAAFAPQAANAATSKPTDNPFAAFKQPKPVEQKAPPQKPFNPIQAFNDVLQPFIPDEARAAAQEAFHNTNMTGPQQAKSILDDTIGGALGGGDALVNLLGAMDPTPKIAAAAAGKPYQAPPPSNMQGAWNAVPGVRQTRLQNLDQSELRQSMVPMMAPIANSAPIFAGEKVLGSLANTAVGQGGAAALMKFNEQIQHGKLNPGEIITTGLEGAAGGVLLHGLGIGAAKTPAIVKNLFKQLTKPLSAAPIKPLNAATNVVPQEAQFNAAVGPVEKLNEEDQLWHKAFFNRKAPDGPDQHEQRGSVQTASAMEPPPKPGESPQPGKETQNTGGHIDPIEDHAQRQKEYQDFIQAETAKEREAAWKQRQQEMQDFIIGEEQAGQYQDATKEYLDRQARAIQKRAELRQQQDAHDAIEKIKEKESANIQNTPEPKPAETTEPMMELRGAQVSRKAFGVINKQFAPTLEKLKRAWKQALKAPEIPGAKENIFYLNNKISELETDFDAALNALVKSAKLRFQDDFNAQMYDFVQRVEDIWAGRRIEEPPPIADSIPDWAKKKEAPISTPTPKEPTSEPSTTYGDSRVPLAHKDYGRNKNAAFTATPLDGHPVYDTPEFRKYTEALAAAKAQQDYDDALLKEFRDKLFKKFANGANEVVFANGSKIVKNEETVLNGPAEDQLDALREKLPGDFTQRGQVAESLMTEKFGEGGLPISHIKIPKDREKAGNIYANLVENQKLSAKEYKALKTNDMHLVFRKAEAALKAIDPQDTVHVLVKTPHPLGDKYAPVEIGIQYKAGSLVKDLTKEGEQTLKQAKNSLLSDAKNTILKTTLKSDVSGYRKTKVLATAALSGVFNMLGSAKAEAANIGGSVANSSMSLIQLMNTTPLNETMLGLFVLHRAAPAIAKLVMEAESGLLVKAAHIWRDTMHYINYSDTLASRVNKFIGGPDVKPFETRINEISGHVQQASMGVHFDETLKAEGLRALRSGKYSALDAFNQKPGSVFAKMSSEEAKSLSMWKVGRNELLKIANERQEFLQHYKWLNENPMQAGETPHSYEQRFFDDNKLQGSTPEALQKQIDTEGLRAYVAAHPHENGDMFMVNRSTESVNFAKENLEGTKAGATGIERFAAEAMSNWMDGLFFWNPQFHGTNLMDQFISGAPVVGHTNIWAANRMIAANIKIDLGNGKSVPIRKLMHDSNLAGGLKVDRAEVAAIAGGKTGKNFAQSDIKSDLYNANAVWIGGALKYHSVNLEHLNAEGWTGSGEKFVQDILAGKSLTGDAEKDAVIYMDLYAKNAEILSRTLGYDTYRINTNALTGQWPGAKFLFMFTKQPARISSLAMHYLAAGDFKPLYVMMGYTMLVGGRAAIPADMRAVYSMLGSPTGADKADHALDELNLYRILSGNTMTPKVENLALWIMTAGTSPILGTKDAIGKAMGMATGQIAAGEPDITKVIKSPVASLVPAGLPMIPGVGQYMKPAGEALRIGKAANKIFGAEERNLYAQLFGGFSPQDTKTIDLTDPADKLRDAVSGLVLPGVSSQQDANQAQTEGQYAIDNYTGLGDWMFGKSSEPSVYTDEYEKQRGIIPAVVTDLFKQLSRSK